MKTRIQQRINERRAQVFEFTARPAFLDSTRERIFHRWLQHDQDELYLADQYDVKRRDIEAAIKAEVRRRLPIPPAFPPARRAA